MKRPVIFVALAGIAAMLASVVVYSALKKREAEVQKAMARTVYIVVAATDLPLGSKVDPGQLKLARWSADAIPEPAANANAAPPTAAANLVNDSLTISGYLPVSMHR